MRGSQKRRLSESSLIRKRLEQQLRGEKKPVKVLPKVNQVSVRGCEDCLDINHPIPRIPELETRWCEVIFVCRSLHFSGRHDAIANYDGPSLTPAIDNDRLRYDSLPHTAVVELNR
jgi:hypothetical protein